MPDSGPFACHLKSAHSARRTHKRTHAPARERAFTPLLITRTISAQTDTYARTHARTSARTHCRPEVAARQEPSRAPTSPTGRPPSQRSFPARPARPARPGWVAVDDAPRQFVRGYDLEQTRETGSARPGPARLTGGTVWPVQGFGGTRRPAGDGRPASWRGRRRAATCRRRADGPSPTRPDSAGRGMLGPGPPPYLGARHGPAATRCPLQARAECAGAPWVIQNSFKAHGTNGRAPRGVHRSRRGGAPLGRVCHHTTHGLMHCGAMAYARTLAGGHAHARTHRRLIGFPA